MKKASRSNKDPNIASLCLRTTPIDNKFPSPAELLLGRQIQDNLPRESDVTTQVPVLKFSVIYKRQVHQKFYYDEHSIPLPSRIPGQYVTVQNPRSLVWTLAVARKKVEGVPRSYFASMPCNRELR